ncbi:GTP pyrophosphokinase [Rugosibacter aromaticivorans]|uniref:GTP pyrophosphokinase n=1 Tax=Rugosibacter aromaticivorans TaxID=1565605 RepID=A0A0C5J8Z7_9PROT|nr:bifunctional (p)ppGpp synthetase/guanosine-3',5'-bis(diphosphate) 3'-pyrophosphohydrolase [Rugosibacter aromaticivorans]AJP48198.1 GTP pyrophosphokinase [Rugosibacter aromaticivorans]ART38365.1 G235 [uncultured bacterium]
MVSLVHTLTQLPDARDINKTRLTEGLDAVASARVTEAIALAAEWYGETRLSSGELTFQHALGTALVVASLGLDADVRVAAMLFAAIAHGKDAIEHLKVGFGETVAELVQGLHRLGVLRPLTRAAVDGREMQAQTEILRKMLLAMVDDIRVVLLRLASRVQTLRFLVDQPSPLQQDMARESLLIYAPLANRLGIWQLKWELEDRAFRYLEPDIYKHIAHMLDERRLARESFIAGVVHRLHQALLADGISAEVYGRPKHIYSIWQKMRSKRLDFSEVYDVRAVRIIVDEEKNCYAALSLVHNFWQPIRGEFDDYIAQPKGNFYRSLHTAVVVEDGGALEVQIRTREMHQHAELGVAAHWRYKEAGKSDNAVGVYEDKIAWLRQLLSWRDEISDSAEWVAQFKLAELDDTIYVLTPQNKVIDLPRGATPLDFAYRLHTDLGHRCRGAKVDGHMVPLNTPLQNGQRVEISAIKSGGPSRDWLSATQGYLVTPQARRKVRQWFAEQDEAELLTQGRAIVMRELQRAGAVQRAQANLDELAAKLGLKSAEAMFLAFARGTVGPHALDIALRGGAEVPPPEPEILTRKSRAVAGAGAGQGGILIVGVDKLLTQIGRCCKPIPPDAIAGFVTRGKGVSIHRVECANFRNMVARSPERAIEAAWGATAGTLAEAIYPVDVHVDANDRQGLLRDISELLTRQKINVTAVKTQSKNGVARMRFTLELAEGECLQKILLLLRDVPGVIGAQRS